MDGRGSPPPEQRKGLLSGRYNQNNNPNDAPLAPESEPARSAPPTGGLLSRFGGQTSSINQGQQGGSGDAGGQQRRGLLSNARKLGDGLRRMTGNATPQSGRADSRAPQHGDWRATDFSEDQIDQWDRNDAAPFDVPPDPDAPRGSQGGRGGRGGRSSRNVRDEWDEWEGSSADGWDAEWDGGGEVDWDNADWDDEPRGRGGRGQSRARRDNRRDLDDYDDSYSGYESAYQPAASQRGGRRQDDWDDWENGDGEWDDWDNRSSSRRRPGANEHWDLVGGLRENLDTDAITDTLVELSAVAPSLTRVARVRMLMQRRPAAAAMLAFCVLGFILTCCAPLAPLLRLGFDTADLARRANDLRTLTAGGVTSIANAANIGRAQQDVAGIESDLYEINGAVTVVGAPFAATSKSAKDIQLLVRIGYDLTGAGNEALQIAQKFVTPLEGGALAANNSTPGIQPADVEQARVLLSDAYLRAQDAVQAYNQIDPNALPAQLKPGTTYGNYLKQLPLAVQVFGEMKSLLDASPALLGIGQPAYYLILALDNTELRPGGGEQGNYGVLELDGGKQSAKNPPTLTDATKFDEHYASVAAPTPALSNCNNQTMTADGGTFAQADPNGVTNAPNVDWWFPYRCLPRTGFGLRDAALSADFPTNARLETQIAEAGGATPNGAPIQGVVAFTPNLIENILAATGGDLPMPGFTDTQTHKEVVITATNLELEIHEQQNILGTTGDRKAFTHDLSTALFARLKTLHGNGLKTLFTVALNALKSKDLQVYLADPRAELLLQQLGLDGSVATGSGDGYLIVDANTCGCKANAYVTETQTDFVTLLPNGGAFHQLEIDVTYNKHGSIFNPAAKGTIPFDDYADLQRTYMPGDATIVGWSGFNPGPYFQPGGCSQGQGYQTIITDCSLDHGIVQTVTNSDIAGRTMVQGSLLVTCGALQNNDFGDYGSDSQAQSLGYPNFSEWENHNCVVNPQSHTQTIFLAWYTPNASTVDASGHGTYSELIEKQAGSVTNLTVYVTHGSLQDSQVVDANSQGVSYFKSLISKSHAQKVFSGPLAQNEMISYSW
jgi:hypothetical protein